MANRQGVKIEERLLAEGQKTKAKLQQKEIDERNKIKNKNVNQTSEKYIIKKFKREFENIVSSMFSEQ